MPNFKNDRSLAKQLSAPQKKFPIHYINPISQFTTTKNHPLQKMIPYMTLLSKPKPHRSLLKKNLIKHFHKLKTPTTIFNKTPNQPNFQVGSMRHYANATPDLIKTHLLQAKEITCQSKYSTMIDLHILRLLNHVIR